MGGPPRKLEKHEKQITGLAFSPDGKTLASVSMDSRLCIWDMTTGRVRHSIFRAHRDKKYGAKEEVYAVAFSPDGKQLATAGADNLVRLWDPAMGKEIRQMEGHQDKVAAVAFSPDGKVLASGSYDGTVRLWNPATGQEIRQLKGHEGRVTAVAFSPDGKTLATGGSAINQVFNVPAGQADQVRLWDVSNGRELRKCQGRGTVVAFSPDGKTVAAGGLVLKQAKALPLARVGSDAWLVRIPDGPALRREQMC